MTYKQPVKNKSRNKVLSYAVRILTTNRNDASCIRNSYVRELIDYFTVEDTGTNNSIEAAKIDKGYLCSWEDLHRSCVGHKTPNELNVCYLAGNEPDNDFDELISLGVHPHNIWAFESEKSVYKASIERYEKNVYGIPKITNRSIEHFFQYSPKKFDIVYLDCCGSAMPSSKHALRIFATLLKNNRLNSPGVIITNFAKPTEDYVDRIYNEIYYRENGLGNVKTLESSVLKKDIKENNDFYYGNYITRSLLDISSLAVPALRFTNSDYWRLLSKDCPKNCYMNSLKSENIRNNSFLFSCLRREEIARAQGTTIDYSLYKEYEGNQNLSIDFVSSIKYIHLLKTKQLNFVESIADIIEYVESGNKLFRFLDPTNYEIILDLLINQLSYPMHYNTNAIRRFMYTAKTNKMYLDVILLDDCRYIYEWMSTIDFTRKVLDNTSWQYILRFALDGLVKQRLNYNDEYFYSGSVIQKWIDSFWQKTLTKREEIV